MSMLHWCNMEERRLTEWNIDLEYLGQWMS